MALASQDVVPEKTLFDVLHDMWRAKISIIICVVLALIAAFAFLAVAHPFYRAEMVIAPANHMGQGLAAAAPIAEGSLQVQRGDLQSNDAFLRFENIYDGVSVSTILMMNEEIRAALAEDQTYTFSNPQKEWSAERLSEYIQKRVKLEPVSGTPLRRMVYLHPNKRFATTMIARIHHITDEIIRARILVGVNERIDYLNAALSRVQNPDHRRNLTALMMEQERIKMLVSLDQPYAATVVEPPSVSSKPRWPDAYIIYAVFVFVGFLSGFVIHGLRHHG